MKHLSIAFVQLWSEICTQNEAKITPPWSPWVLDLSQKESHPTKQPNSKPETDGENKMAYHMTDLDKELQNPARDKWSEN